MRLSCFLVWVVIGACLFLAGCAFHLGADKLGVDWTVDRMAPVPSTPAAPVNE